jgi:hypothetical protein
MISTIAPDEVVSFRINPGTLLQLLDARAEGGPLLKCFEGSVTLVSPGRPHESMGLRLDRLIMLVCLELGISHTALGSSTWALPFGAGDTAYEPDEAYYVQSRGLAKPHHPPDLAIEVVVTNPEGKALQAAAPEPGLPRPHFGRGPGTTRRPRTRRHRLPPELPRLDTARPGPTPPTPERGRMKTQSCGVGQSTGGTGGPASSEPERLTLGLRTRRRVTSPTRPREHPRPAQGRVYPRLERGGRGAESIPDGAGPLRLDRRRSLPGERRHRCPGGTRSQRPR